MGHWFFPAAAALGGASLLSFTTPVKAQSLDAAAKVRALNLARNSAVSENGGLTVYRPQPCMFNTSNGGGECLIRNNAQGFTFKFLGGKPGWPENGSDPTTETEIQISPDGRSVNQIVYNGSPR